jgi:signal transduction histidine kinase
VEYLPVPLALPACLVLWGVIVAPFVLVYGTQTAIFWMMPVLAAIVFVAAFTRVMVSEQRARAELAETHRKLRQYAVQVEELAVVQERNRLAREIHDGLGHYLTAIHVQIKAAAASQGQDEDALRGALENAQRLAGEALADVRKSVSALRADPATQRPLAERIEYLAAEARSGGLRIDLVQNGAPRPLEAQADFALYRAAQEALTNIRKHAQASSVRVELSYRPASVFLAVQDDGVGVSAPESGFGLIGLRERVELLDGTLRVHSAVGQGFCLEVEIPLADQADRLAD